MFVGFSTWKKKVLLMTVWFGRVSMNSTKPWTDWFWSVHDLCIVKHSWGTIIDLLLSTPPFLIDHRSTTTAEKYEIFATPYNQCVNHRDSRVINCTSFFLFIFRFHEIVCGFWHILIISSVFDGVEIFFSC